MGRGWLALPMGIALAVLLAAVGCASLVSSGGLPRADVEPRASLEAYSWEELASISSQVARCADADSAVACAARYGLCRPDGSIDAQQVKAMPLADGRTVGVALAGVWHDTRTDGGKAGLTFAFADAVGPHAMNHSPVGASSDFPDSMGGWTASDMRAWMMDSLFLDLPYELRTCLASVQKRTASGVDSLDEADEPGHVTGAADDWVGETSDKLWLFSAAELCGSVPVNESLGVDESMARVYSAEGEQYRLFRDAGVAAFTPNGALERFPAGESEACTWWLRTKTLEFGGGFWLVGTDGTPLNGLGEDARVVNDPGYAPENLWGPEHPRGVIVGFCL